MKDEKRKSRLGEFSRRLYNLLPKKHTENIEFIKEKDCNDIRSYIIVALICSFLSLTLTKLIANGHPELLWTIYATPILLGIFDFSLKEKYKELKAEDFHLYVSLFSGTQIIVLLLKLILLVIKDIVLIGISVNIVGFKAIILVLFVNVLVLAIGMIISYCGLITMKLMLKQRLSTLKPINF